MSAIRKITCYAQRTLLGAALILSLAPFAYGQTRRSRSVEVADVGNSTREARDSAVNSIPFPHLTPQAKSRLAAVVENSSYFRRMPVQTVSCEPEIFTALARNPEVIVAIWDAMGITRVTLNRLSQYQHSGSDGAGTTCEMDLVYGNDSTHVYFVEGSYKGPMWAKELTGKSLIVLHNKNHEQPDGSHQMAVWMDVFLKIDNLGADLIVRTLGPLVSKSADSNFIESMGFVSQVSQTAMQNPKGLETLVSRLRISQNTKDQFLSAVRTASARANRKSISALSEPPQSLKNSAGLYDSGDSNMSPVLLMGSKPLDSKVPPASPSTSELPLTLSTEPVSSRKKPTIDPTPKPTDSPTISKLNLDGR